MARRTRPNADPATAALTQAQRLDADTIDRLYQLEPVYEPGADPRQRPLEQDIDVQCPHCWQSYAIRVDLTLGRQMQIEDCPLCCHPLELHIEPSADGRDAQVTAQRLDQ